MKTSRSTASTEAHSAEAHRAENAQKAHNDGVPLPQRDDSDCRVSNRASDITSCLPSRLCVCRSKP